MATLRSLGAIVIDPVTLPDAEKIAEPEFAALRHEFKYGINAYLAYLAEFAAGGALPRTLAELIDFNKRNSDLVLSRFGQDCSSRPRPPAATWPTASTPRAARGHPAGSHRHLHAGGRAPVEAIVALTANPACLTDYVLGDHDVFHTSGPAAVAGCPSVTVPCGYVSGLPVGLSFFGPRWTEPRLIALAYAFEQATASASPPPWPPASPANSVRNPR